jgi:hypothetical protein
MKRKLSSCWQLIACEIVVEHTVVENLARNFSMLGKMTGFSIRVIGTMEDSIYDNRIAEPDLLMSGFTC